MKMSRGKQILQGAQAAGSAISRVAKGSVFSGNHTKYVQAAHAAGKKVPILGNAAQWTTPGWNNFFTGVQLKKGTDVGLALGATAIGAGIGVKEGTFDQTQEGIIARAEQAGDMPRMGGDGLGYGMAPPQRNLGASGDIVFGLHNTRKGR